MPKTKEKTRDQSIREMRAVHSTTSRVEAGIKTIEKLLAPPPINKAKEKKMQKLFEKLDKKYKSEGVVTTIASGTRSSNISVVPSGWQEMDDLITGETDSEARTVPGSGLGWPRGRIIEVYGDEGVGKTTLTLQIIAAFQKAGEECAFVDAEHALDVSYAKKLGVDLTRLKLSQPDQGGERALSVVNELADSGLFGCIVVDSVAALTPQSELEADFEDNAQPARQAALMSKALRKLTSTVSKNNVLLVFINQQRIKIGVRFGNPKTTAGGQALKFYASVRLELVMVKTVKKGDRVILRRTRVRTVKNKVAPPFRDVFCDVVPNRGFTTVHADPDFGGGSDDE
jgi:recombination protein RecA